MFPPNAERHFFLKFLNKEKRAPSFALYLINFIHNNSMPYFDENKNTKYV
jgi:hypothetical protein